ncbi:MAG: hypothetical protein J7M19_01335 [Planctomycetes bacterium]|nr:hypothetical protein [Planctomycetota bacterium]
MREKLPGNPQAALRAVLAGLFVFGLFTSIFHLLIHGWGPSSSVLGIRAPDDWHNLLRFSITAVVASAAGVLIYGGVSRRPMVIALAIGIIFIDIDTYAIWQQVIGVAGTTISLPRSVTAKLGSQTGVEWDWVIYAMKHSCSRLYWVYYLIYCFWAIVILYSGYIGQYVVGRLVTKESKVREESAIYVAERAGVGLLAGTASGVTGMLIAAALSSLVVAGPVVAAGGTERGLMQPAPAIEAGNASSREAGPQGKAPSAGTAGVTGNERGAAGRFFQTRRTYVLLAALAFFATAYITALVVRPRTSTWVACGAVLGVMVPPAAALFFFHSDPEHLEGFFKFLQLSPFTLAGVAIAASVTGDWAGSQLVARARRRYKVLLKPL